MIYADDTTILFATILYCNIDQNVSVLNMELSMVSQ